MNKRAVFHLVSYMTLVIGVAIIFCASSPLDAPAWSAS
jgi:hypothetical protein